MISDFERTCAAYMALGMVAALYRTGDIPEHVMDTARDILVRAGEVVEPIIEETSKC